MYQSRIIVCGLTLATLTARPGVTQGAAGALTHPAPIAQVTRVEPGTITIDGRIDEAAWGTAGPATQRTDVRILIDGDAIYFGARMFESDPAKLRPRLARRDEAERRRRYAAAASSDEQTAALSRRRLPFHP